MLRIENNPLSYYHIVMLNKTVFYFYMLYLYYIFIFQNIYNLHDKKIRFYSILVRNGPIARNQ
jgi:hypothetical protein